MKRLIALFLMSWFVLSASASEFRLMAFDTIDADRNGHISKEEAKVNADLSKIFDQLDTNSDGQLSPEEYAQYKS